MDIPSEPSEEVVDMESCEVSSPIENDSPALNNIWDDDKIEKVSNKSIVVSHISYQYLTLSTVYR